MIDFAIVFLNVLIYELPMELYNWGRFENIFKLKTGYLGLDKENTNPFREETIGLQQMDIVFSAFRKYEIRSH